MLIRPAQIEDVPFLEDLLRQILRFHHQGRPDIFRPDGSKYSREQVADLVADKEHLCLIAEQDATPCGYLLGVYREHCGNSVLSDRKYLYIDDLCVLPEERGQDVGTALMRAAEEAAEKNGCTNTELNVWCFSGCAESFYEKMGYRNMCRHMEKRLPNRKEDF